MLYGSDYTTALTLIRLECYFIPREPRFYFFSLLCMTHFSLLLPRQKFQIPSATVVLSAGEKSQIQIAQIMVHSATAAVSPCQLGTHLWQHCKVAFQPWVLMSTNHNAGFVAPQHQHGLIGEGPVGVQPVLQCQIRENIRRLGKVDQFGKVASFQCLPHARDV